MNGSSTTIHRSSSRELRGFRSFVWITSLMSLAVVFFGMQLMMVGPLSGRLDGIDARLERSESGLSKLVAARDGVWRTNDLLTSLEDQTSRISGLTKSIDDIQRLRNQIENEADAATVALAALDRMTALQRRIVGEQQVTQSAAQQFDRMQEIQERLARQADQVDVAAATFDGMLALQNRVIAASNDYEQASESVANLNDLTQRIAASSADLELAARTFDEFVGLKNAVASASGDIDTARSSLNDMVALKDQVAAVAPDVAAANETARTLVALNEQLTGGSLQLETAHANLDALIGIERSLADQSDTIAAAIRNIEIMDDFRLEVDSHVRSLATLRRTLVDVAMMESTLGRVARVLGPLTEIGSLRRLSESEVQEAARIILDRRTTRLSQNGDAGVGSSDNGSADDDADLVPLPPEARSIN